MSSSSENLGSASGSLATGMVFRLEFFSSGESLEGSPGGMMEGSAFTAVSCSGGVLSDL